jgi:coenzyme F420 biosynthesis associated uncharacterized protein
MQLVDWRVAEATATRLVPPGPRLPLSEAADVVAQLRDLAAEASGHVATYTGLDAGDSSATTVVVDRPEWVRANVDGFRRLADPLLARLVEQRGVKGVGGSGLAGITPKAAGVEVGALLSYLATRVLGQFELLGPPPSDGGPGVGRLSLVAPNIVATERAMRVDPRDFRLWVCLHEVTHRTQFATAPWLHDHVRELLGDYLEAADLEPAALLGRLRGALSGVTQVILGRSEASLVELLQTLRQQEILDRVTGLMSLLEGQADVVMDGVGPQVVGSVDTIRSRFERRRHDNGRLETAVRRLLGVEAKMRQYAEGAGFVRAVVDAAGMSGLNRVWSGPEWLPTGTEIRNPHAWLTRAGFPPAIPA